MLNLVFQLGSLSGMTCGIFYSVGWINCESQPPPSTLLFSTTNLPSDSDLNQSIQQNLLFRIMELLSNTEWEQSAELATALQPFHQATKRLEGIIKGGYGSLWECLPVMEYLLLTSRHRLRRVSARLHWLRRTMPGIPNKLHIHYNLTDRLPYYVAAMILHPHSTALYKWRYFEIT